MSRPGKLKSQRSLETRRDETSRVRNQKTASAVFVASEKTIATRISDSDAEDAEERALELGIVLGKVKGSRAVFTPSWPRHVGDERVAAFDDSVLVDDRGRLDLGVHSRGPRRAQPRQGPRRGPRKREPKRSSEGCHAARRDHGTTAAADSESLELVIGG
jgi:hypothetical protein